MFSTVNPNCSAKLERIKSTEMQRDARLEMRGQDAVQLLNLAQDGFGRYVFLHDSDYVLTETVSPR